MKTYLKRLLLMTLLGSGTVGFAGLPEPGLNLYGVVQNNLGGAHARLTQGSIEWTISPAGGGQSVTVTANVTNINDQLSYVVHLPFETELLPNFPLSTNALKLAAVPTSFNISQVTVNGLVATAAVATVEFSREKRGEYERVDLKTAIPFLDGDNDDMDDNWEVANWGTTDPPPDGDTQIGGFDGDTDNDGLTNLQEFLAGTDPNQATSVLQITLIEYLPSGDTRLTWETVGTRTYTVLRSTNPITGFAAIASGLPGAPPVNEYTDESGETGRRYYYRIELE